MVFDDYTGTLSFHRGINGSLAPAWSIRTEREFEGPAFIVDVDDNGTLEFVSVDESGKLLHTRSSE